jgi:predicted DNA-binding protein
MPTKKKQQVEAAPPTKAPRQSVTFAPEIYAELERLSKQKKVSIAWVVREATEQYVANQYPLFAVARDRSAL